MADPAPAKKVFSIFAPRPKPPARASPPPVHPPTSTPGPASFASDTSSTGQASSQTRTAASETAKDADCITLGSSDDEHDSQPSASAPSRKRTTRGATSKKAHTGKDKAKAKTKHIIVDSDNDSDYYQQSGKQDEDLIVVKDTTPGKKTSFAKKAARKNGKGKDKAESFIDLTTSSPSPRKAPSSFAPLSDLYRQERERRKLLQEGLEPRWPTAEEHGNYLELPHSSSSSSLASDSARKRYPRHSNDKGKAREPEHDFFSEFYPSLAEARTPLPIPLSHKSLPTASTSSLIPQNYPSHPLLDRLAASLRSNAASTSTTPSSNDESTSESQLWTTKYGPRTAREVLGDVSGQSALVLREWLQELKVADSSNADRDVKSSRKRKRQVNRGIDRKKLAKKKKRRAEGLDDFLASSSSEEQDDHAGGGANVGRLGLNSLLPDDDDDSALDDFDDDSVVSSSRARPDATALSSVSSNLFHRLTNLILLVGPTGAGKTVSVHAVAQELGYEIFEVNSGMGKRRAKDIESEVGDVGKNHIVSAASPRKKHGAANEGRPVKDFFAGFRTAASASNGTTMTTATGSGNDRGRGGGTTQSLILIEEVDVLFVGEEDFWFGIRQLAQESRRPIILTCNDSSSIPFDQLGLQKIHLPASGFSDPLVSLPFSPPPSSLVVPYLELIALSEGHIVEPRVVQRLYERSTEYENDDDDDDDEVDTWLCDRNGKEKGLPHPVKAARDEEVGRPGDLRKSILQLQFELSHRRRNSEDWIVGALRCDDNHDDGGSGRAGDGTEGDWLERIVRATDSISFADAYVTRRIDARLEDLESGTFLTASDVVLSPTATPLSPFVSSCTKNHHQLASIGIERSLVTTMTSLACHLASVAAPTPSVPTPFAPLFEFPIPAPFSASQVARTQVAYLSTVTALSDSFFYSHLTESYVATTPFLPGGTGPPSLIVDHLPLWRHLTSIDDERERVANDDQAAAAAAAGKEKGRATTIDLEAARTGTGRGVGGVRRSTRVVGGGGGGGGGDGGGNKVKVKREIEWRDLGELEFIRKSGFDGV